VIAELQSNVDEANFDESTRLHFHRRSTDFGLLSTGRAAKGRGLERKTESKRNKVKAKKCRRERSEKPVRKCSSE